MGFMGLHHLGLPVQDAEKSLEFYTKGLGGKEVYRFPMGDTGKHVYFVDMGNNAVIEISGRGTGEEEANARWSHICLQTDDIDAAFKMAINAGAESRVEPRDAKLGNMSVRLCFVYGPDREQIEFFQVLEGGF